MEKECHGGIGGAREGSRESKSREREGSGGETEGAAATIDVFLRSTPPPPAPLPSHPRFLALFCCFYARFPINEDDKHEPAVTSKAASDRNWELSQPQGGSRWTSRGRLPQQQPPRVEIAPLFGAPSRPRASLRVLGLHSRGVSLDVADELRHVPDIVLLSKVSSRGEEMEEGSSKKKREMK